MTIQKPFLKWVGGKNQMMNTILSKVPSDIENYHELFVGGGSVLLGILSLRKEKTINIRGKIYAYDINKDLINVYKQIQKNEEQLYTYMEHYFTEYDNIEGNVVNRNPTDIQEAKSSKESYYYWIRSMYNKGQLLENERAAIFIFLNKTCFRGIYREGPNGFNVPYGHYKKTPAFITKCELNTISKLIEKVEFASCSFTDSIKRIGKDDFVYLDPPYAPETKNSFVGYNKEGFNLDMHKQLFDEVKKMHTLHANFLMSNARVELVMTQLKDFHFEEIVARRAINSKNPESTTMEVLINNY